MITGRKNILKERDFYGKHYKAIVTQKSVLLFEDKNDYYVLYNNIVSDSFQMFFSLFLMTTRFVGYGVAPKYYYQYNGTSIGGSTTILLSLTNRPAGNTSSGDLGLTTAIQYNLLRGETNSISG